MFREPILHDLRILTISYLTGRLMNATTNGQLFTILFTIVNINTTLSGNKLQYLKSLLTDEACVKALSHKVIEAPSTVHVSYHLERIDY